MPPKIEIIGAVTFPTSERPLRIPAEHARELAGWLEKTSPDLSRKLLLASEADEDRELPLTPDEKLAIRLAVQTHAYGPKPRYRGTLLRSLTHDLK